MSSIRENQISENKSLNVLRPTHFSEGTGDCKQNGTHDRFCISFSWPFMWCGPFCHECQLQKPPSFCEPYHFVWGQLGFLKVVPKNCIKLISRNTQGPGGSCCLIIHNIHFFIDQASLVRFISTFMKGLQLLNLFIITIRFDGLKQKSSAILSVLD